MTTIDYKKFRLYGYPGFGLILYLLFYLINPLDEGLKYLEASSSLEFFIEVFSAIIFAAIIFEVGLQLSIVLNRYLPWQKAPRRRFVIQFTLQIITISLVLLLLFKLNIPSDTVIDELTFRQALILGTIFSLLITAIFTAEFFFKNWTQAQTETLKLKELALQSQLETLVAQIDPHFLFNNFSTLTALIEEDPKAATKFLSSLSDVYRYILTNKQASSVSLEKELSVLREYFYLYKKRYANGLELSIDIPFEAMNRQIAPITLQILIENALKHNAFSLNKPLCIKITYQNGLLTVSNTLNPKAVKETSTGIGLKNVIERHQLLFQKKIIAIKEDGVFTVTIPLV
jgi:sensor histidine kinase YesM